MMGLASSIRLIENPWFIQDSFSILVFTLLLYSMRIFVLLYTRYQCNSKVMVVYQQNPEYTECLLDLRVCLLIGLFCHYLWLYGLNVGLAEFWVRIQSETFTKFSPGLNNLPNIYMLKFTNQEKTLNNFIPIAWKVYPIQMKINVLNFEKIRIIMSDYFFLVENFPFYVGCLRQK